MCSWIVEKANVSGTGKGPNGWFDMRQANVYYDHPYKAPMDHALIIDFVEDPEKAGNRVSVEMSAESAQRLIACIQSALSTGEVAHAE
ncbi:MAG: DUF6295 family protein [Planctomycetota bacterium]|jgi:hypothetical protein